MMMKPTWGLVLLSFLASQSEAALNFRETRAEGLAASPHTGPRSQHGPKDLRRLSLPKARHLTVERKLKAKKKKKAAIQAHGPNAKVEPAPRADPEGNPVGTTNHDMFCYQNPDDPACYCYHNPQEQGCSEKFCDDFPEHSDCLCVSSTMGFDRFEGDMGFDSDGMVFPSEGNGTVSCKRQPSYCELFPYDFECQCYFHPDSDPYCQQLRCESTPEDPDCRCFINGYDDPACACELWGDSSYECQCSQNPDDRECYCNLFGYEDPTCACDLYGPDSSQCQCFEDSSLDFCRCLPPGESPLYEDPDCACTIWGENSYDCACSEDPLGETCRCFQDGYDDPACACTIYGEDSLECKCSTDATSEECKCLNNPFAYSDLACACALYGSESQECQCAAEEDATASPCFCELFGWSNAAECGCQIFGEDSFECMCASNPSFDSGCECILDPESCYFPETYYECNNIDGDYQILIQGPADVDGEIVVASSFVAIRGSSFGVGQVQMCATPPSDSVALPFASTSGHVVMTTTDMYMDPKTFTGSLDDGQVMNGSLTCWENKMQFGLVDGSTVYMVSGTRVNDELNPETGCPESETE